MARRGTFYEIKKKFEDYDYIILGVGGVGKTTLSYELGKKVSGGSDEGTYIMTCGAENLPDHMGRVFGELDRTFEDFVEGVDYLCKHRDEYPDTKFVAIDSIDEWLRIVSDYVVREWNRTCEKAGKPEEKSKNLAGSYKGFNKGEKRAIDLMIKQIIKLKDAGYHLIYIGHTATRSASDNMQQVKFDQLTCSIPAQFYNAIKDKANLAVMCYFENEIVGIKEEKNPFNKKMEKKGTLVNKKRVMLFTDDSNTVDTKTHFEYIVNKADMSADNLIKAVEDAIAAKLAAPVGAHKSPEMVEMAMPTAESSSDDEETDETTNTTDIDNLDDLDPDTSDVDIDMDGADHAPTIEDLRTEVQGKLRTASAEVKKKAREILITEAADPEKIKLADATVETLNKILAVLD